MASWSAVLGIPGAADAERLSHPSLSPDFLSQGTGYSNGTGHRVIKSGENEILVGQEGEARELEEEPSQ